MWPSDAGRGKLPPDTWGAPLTTERQRRLTAILAVDVDDWGPSLRLPLSSFDKGCVTSGGFKAGTQRSNTAG